METDWRMIDELVLNGESAVCQNIKTEPCFLFFQCSALYTLW